MSGDAWRRRRLGFSAQSRSGRGQSPDLGSLFRSLKCAPVDHCDPYHPFQPCPSEQFCEPYEALNNVNGRRNCAIMSAYTQTLYTKAAPKANRRAYRCGSEPGTVAVLPVQLLATETGSWF